MKNLRLIIFTFLMLVTINSFAQMGIKEKMKTSTIKTYQTKINGETVTYKVKIIEQRKFPSTVVRKGKKNKNVAYVTKLISVDNDRDKAYDRLIVLRYKKEPTDTFRTVSTTNGFAVEVDGRKMEFLVGEGTYVMENNDDDYFIVEEFDRM